MGCSPCLVRGEDGHLAHLLPDVGAPEARLELAQTTVAEVREVPDLSDDHGPPPLSSFSSVMVLANRPMVSARLIPRVALTPPIRAAREFTYVPNSAGLIAGVGLSMISGPAPNFAVGIAVDWHPERWRLRIARNLQPRPKKVCPPRGRIGFCAHYSVGLLRSARAQI